MKKNYLSKLYSTSPFKLLKKVWAYFCTKHFVKINRQRHFARTGSEAIGLLGPNDII